MNLLDLPKLLRLAAYLDAGERIATGKKDFSCHALDDAIRDRIRDRNVFVCGTSEDTYWKELFCDGREYLSPQVVETRDERWPKYARDHARNRKAMDKARLAGKLPTTAQAVASVRLDQRWKEIHADAKETRLMMLAWIHALDQAGDLEEVLS